MDPPAGSRERLHGRSTCAKQGRAQSDSRCVNDASLRPRGPVLYPVTTLEARQQSLESGKRPYLKASRGVIASTAWLTALMRLKNLGWLSRTTAKAGSIVFHLRDIEGFSTKETAQTLHRSLPL